MHLDLSPDVAEQTRFLKGHPHCNSRIYPRFQPQLEKNHEIYPSPSDKARFPCIACRAIPCSPSNTKGALTFLMDSRESRRTLSQVERHPEVTTATRKCSVYPKSTRDEARFTSIGSRAIPISPLNTTSGLISFRKLKGFPRNTVPSLEGHQVQQSNSRKAPSTPNHLKMRADSLALTQEECRLSRSTS